MTCVHRDLFLGLDRLRASSDMGWLAAHAKDCADCAGVLSLRASVIPLLGQPPEPMDEGTRARLWSRIDEARVEAPRSLATTAAHFGDFIAEVQRRPLTSAILAGALAASVCLLVAGLDRGTEESPRLSRGSAALLSSGSRLPAGVLPEGEWLSIAEESRIELSPSAALDVLRPALVFYTRGPEAEIAEIRMAEGEIDLRVDASAKSPLWLVTPVARIEAIGARLRLVTNRVHTGAEVSEGTVLMGAFDEARPEATDAMRTVRQGGHAEVDAPPPAKTDPPRPAAEAPPEREREHEREHERERERAPSKAEASPIHSVRTAQNERPSAAQEASPPEAPSLGVERDRAELKRARSLLGRDDGEARSIAQTVLVHRPPPATEILALAVAADACRRRGMLDEADRYYAKMLVHPDGAGFEEEALYRRAAIAHELGRNSDTLAFVGLLRSRHPKGALAPERDALEARAMRALAEKKTPGSL